MSVANDSTIKLELRFQGPFADALRHVRLQDPTVQRHLNEGLANLAAGLGAFFASMPRSSGGAA